MTLSINYFAWVRDRMGVSEEVLDPARNLATVADLIDWLRDRDDRGAAAFANPARIRAAVDGEMTGLDASIMGAKDIALFPPVTGG